MTDSTDNDATRDALTMLVGQDRMRGVDIAEARALEMPTDPAQREAVELISLLMLQLQAAVETYDIARGVWRGKPHIAVVFRDRRSDG